MCSGMLCSRSTHLLFFLFQVLLLANFTSFSLPFQGIRQIRIGTKLQEIGSQHQYEGWAFMHYSMAGTNIAYLQDMCTELFGEVGDDAMEQGQFDSPLPKSSELRQTFKRPRWTRLWVFSIPLSLPPRSMQTSGQ